MNKLNVGCGDHYAKGWLNVDIAESPKVKKDLQGDITKGLDFEDGHFQRIYLGHVLEHLSPKDVGKGMVEVMRLLSDGGQVLIVGPDCIKARATGDERLIRGAVYGAGRWANDIHLWECDEEKMVNIAKAAQLKDVKAITIKDYMKEWPVVADVIWQSGVFGRKTNK